MTPLSFLAGCLRAGACATCRLCSGSGPWAAAAMKEYERLTVQASVEHSRERHSRPWKRIRWSGKRELRSRSCRLHACLRGADEAWLRRGYGLLCSGKIQARFTAGCFIGSRLDTTLRNTSGWSACFPLAEPALAVDDVLLNDHPAHNHFQREIGKTRRNRCSHLRCRKTPAPTACSKVRCFLRASPRTTASMSLCERSARASHTCALRPWVRHLRKRNDRYRGTSPT